MAATSANICVRRNRPAFARGQYMSCKRIARVTTVAQAAQIATRVARKAALQPGEYVAIRLGGRAPAYDEGNLYWFFMRHGKIECRRGAMFGPRCES
jgi:hypothetical protein